MKAIQSIQIVGIKGDQTYESWKKKVRQAIKELYLPLELEEINQVKAIVKMGLGAIPALLVDGKVLMEQGDESPEPQKIKASLHQYLENGWPDCKKIIVPTDFSPAAQNAYQYASALVEDWKGELQLLHVCHPKGETIEGVPLIAVEDLVEERKVALADFTLATEPANMKQTVVDSLVDREVVVGFASDVLVKKSAEEDTDLIVMSTRGEGNVMDRAFGSISSSVSQKANCPVWLIPPNTKYRGIHNILYASNYASADERMVNRILTFAQPFGADVHLVHVNDQTNNDPNSMDELVIDKLFANTQFENTLYLSTIHSDRIWEGLNSYAHENAIDLIVLVTRHRNFWQRLLHRSVTREMVLNAELPLLILHLDDQ